MVRALQLAAIWTFSVRRRTQRMMRATHVATGRRDFLFGNGHDRLDGGCWGDRGYLAKFQGGGNSDGNTCRSAKAGGRSMRPHSARVLPRSRSAANGPSRSENGSSASAHASGLRGKGGSASENS